MLVRRLYIQANTEKGMFGVNIPFSSGLNLLHAENSEGKSSCVQAMIYALGLEGALGPSRKVPLKEVLTKDLDDEQGQSHKVIESKVFLELESNEQCITVSRSSIKEKSDLIHVWNDHVVTKKLTSSKPTDYYVRLGGAAVMERGFHAFLSEFIGFQLPTVLKYDGGKCPLYLETLFSLFYVEQTKGWGGIQSILPKYLGIRDVGEKAIEFVLGLDSFTNNEKKHDLNQKAKLINNNWQAVVIKLRELAKRVGAVVSGVPESPVSNFETEHVYRILGYFNGKQIELKLLLSELEDKHSELKHGHIPSVNQAEMKLEQDLSEKMDYLSRYERNLSYLIEDSDNSSAYVDSISQRIEHVEEDLRQYKDINRLINLGSKEDFGFPNNTCPTCGSVVEDSLLQHTHNHEVLTIEENIAYLENQKKSLKQLLRSETARSIKKKNAIFNGRQELSRIRQSIRQLKESLINDGRIPSREALKEELELESRIELVKSSLSDSERLFTQLIELSKEFNRIKNKLSLLPKRNLSDNDFKKLIKLKKYFVESLVLFGYKSTGVDEFEISEYTYKPVIDEVELGFEASASDNIRIIWAYLYALMQLARDNSVNLNHLGLIIMDEPRQQEAKEESFREFIKLTSDSIDFNQQVIMATSEKQTELVKFTESAEHDINVIHFEGNLLKLLSKDEQIIFA